MKKNFILFTTLSIFTALAIMGNEWGVAHVNGLNRTGSSGLAPGCDGSGCHSGGTFTNVMPPTVEITDVDGYPTNYFMPGNTYIINMKGTSTAPKWGFQVSGYHLDTSLNRHSAGWLSGTMPYSHDTFIGNYSVVEQAMALNVVNDTIATTVFWLAPTMPIVDTVYFPFTICNIDDDGTADGDNFVSYSDTLGHWTTETVFVSERFRNNIDVTVYPNPASNRLNIRPDDISKGDYYISVFNMSGKPLAWQRFNTNTSRELNLDISNWPAGTYRVIVQKGNTQKVVPIVKI